MGLLCLIWGGYFFAVRSIKTDKHQQITLCKDNFSRVYQVNSVKMESEGAILHGFAFELDSDAKEGNIEIVLHDIESGENHFSKMEYLVREDVNEFFLCEYECLIYGYTMSMRGTC